MECRVKRRQSQTPGFRAPIYGSAYFNQFKDKKCFCARGYYPRGPICSGESEIRQLKRYERILTIRNTAAVAVIADRTTCSGAIG